MGWSPWELLAPGLSVTAPVLSEGEQRARLRAPDRRSCWARSPTPPRPWNGRLRGRRNRVHACSVGQRDAAATVLVADLHRLDESGMPPGMPDVGMSQATSGSSNRSLRHRRILPGGALLCDQSRVPMNATCPPGGNFASHHRLPPSSGVRLRRRIEGASSPREGDTTSRYASEGKPFRFRPEDADLRATGRRSSYAQPVSRPRSAPPPGEATLAPSDGGRPGGASPVRANRPVSAAG